MQKTYEHDVLIVGAGISGISSACHLARYCPDKSYTIIEARDEIGGTWDLFKYPGIRSDSDMYTLGFSFRPWEAEKSIADAPSIMAYLRDTITDQNLAEKIQFNRKAVRAQWSSHDNRWQVDVEDAKNGVSETHYARFIHMCTGYYNYDGGYRPQFTDEADFGGEIVHPQFWPEDLDYADKKVVVIGSGATAVTLVPSMAETAQNVTMLQRSPTYIVSMPAINRFANRMRAYLPSRLAYGIVRWHHILFQRFMYWYCRRFPDRAKEMLLKGVHDQVPAGFDVEKHLTPSYNPWDQRLCLAPDGDFFEALCSGKADIATDTIERFTKDGIALASGAHLDADIIVTATGLDLSLFGNMDIIVDGEAIKLGAVTSYKGMMFSDIPNLALSTGYTNASWTLKCDLTSRYLCRLLNFMDRKNYGKAVAYAKDVAHAPFLNLTSGYIARKAADLPKQGEHVPWRMYQNYVLDLMMLRFGRLKDGALQFSSDQAPDTKKQEEDLPIAAE